MAHSVIAYCLFDSGTREAAKRYRLMRALDLQRNTMFKPIVEMGAAALVAGLFVFVTSVAPETNVPDVERALPQSFAKGDRLSGSGRGSACSQRGWPNFEQNCQFDLRRPSNQARTVRVIDLH